MLLSLQELQEEKITILDLIYNFYIISGEMDSSLRNIFWISCSYVFMLSLMDKLNRKVTQYSDLTLLATTCTITNSLQICHFNSTFFLCKREASDLQFLFEMGHYFNLKDQSPACRLEKLLYCTVWITDWDWFFFFNDLHTFAYRVRFIELAKSMFF